MRVSERGDNSRWSRPGLLLSNFRDAVGDAFFLSAGDADLPRLALAEDFCFLLTFRDIGAPYTPAAADAADFFFRRFPFFGRRFLEGPTRATAKRDE